MGKMVDDNLLSQMTNNSIEETICNEIAKKNYDNRHTKEYQKINMNSLTYCQRVFHEKTLFHLKTSLHPKERYKCSYALTNLPL